MRYAKTPKGHVEIRGRSRPLSGAPADALRQLQDLGLITAADQPAAATKPLWNSPEGQSEPTSDAQGPDTLSVSSDDYLRLHAHMEALGSNRSSELLHDLSA